MPTPTPRPTTPVPKPPPTADQLKATLTAAVASGKFHATPAQIDAIVAHLVEFFAAHHS